MRVYIYFNASTPVFPCEIRFEILFQQNPDCSVPDVSLLEECSQDCQILSTECSIKCNESAEIALCISDCNREYSNCLNFCPCNSECYEGCPCDYENQYCSSRVIVSALNFERAETDRFINLIRLKVITNCDS